MRWDYKGSLGYILLNLFYFFVYFNKILFISKFLLKNIICFYRINPLYWGVFIAWYFAISFLSVWGLYKATDTQNIATVIAFFIDIFLDLLAFDLL